MQCGVLLEVQTDILNRRASALNCYSFEESFWGSIKMWCVRYPNALIIHDWEHIRRKKPNWNNLSPTDFSGFCSGSYPHRIWLQYDHDCMLPILLEVLVSSMKTRPGYTTFRVGEFCIAYVTLRPSEHFIAIFMPHRVPSLHL